MSLEPHLDPASQAFERLRLEVALLRRALEGLAAEAREPVDYSPTLAKLSETLAGVEEVVVEVAGRPMLAMTAEHHIALLRRMADPAIARSAAEFRQAHESLQQAAQTLKLTIGAARDLESQRRWLLGASLAGFVAGAVIWTALLGPLARAAPSSWQVPERLAAATLAMPRLQAGVELIHGADPALWRAVELGDLLIRSDPDEVRDCLQRRRESTKPVRCEFELPASPSGPDEPGR